MRPERRKNTITMGKKTLDLKYGEAMAEIESIIASLENGEADIDSLSERVGRASELIAMCRGRLRKAEEEVKRILEEDKTEM